MKGGWLGSPGTSLPSATMSSTTSIAALRPCSVREELLLARVFLKIATEGGGVKWNNDDLGS
jgi:hypothetical protein